MMHKISDGAFNALDDKIAAALYTAQVIERDATDMTAADGDSPFMIDQNTGNRLCHFVYQQTRLIEELRNMLRENVK